MPVRKNDARAIVAQRPQLRIIDEETWHATQERLAHVRRFYTRGGDGKAKGRAVPGRHTPYLFSSLLCCGVCGGKMIIAGGSADVYYRWEGNKKRGTCSNTLSVRESTTRTSLLDELRRRLLSDNGLAYARKRVAERLGELVRERDAEAREHRQRLDKLVVQIDKLVDFVAEGHGSAAVAEKLRGLERAADAERSRLAVLEKQAALVVKLPSPDDLMGMVFDLEKRLLADATRGREELRRIFRDGRIALVPQPGGFYVARSEILPLVLLTLSPSPGASSEDSSGGRCPASSCGGRFEPLSFAHPFEG